MTSYVDEAIVGGASVAAHFTLLKAALERVGLAGLTVKSSKVCRRWIRFPGHRGSAAVLEADPDEVAAIRDWPRPLSAKLSSRRALRGG